MIFYAIKEIQLTKKNRFKHALSKLHHYLRATAFFKRLEKLSPNFKWEQADEFVIAKKIQLSGGNADLDAIKEMLLVHYGQEIVRAYRYLNAAHDFSGEIELGKKELEGVLGRGRVEKKIIVAIKGKIDFTKFRARTTLLGPSKIRLSK